MKRVRSAVRSRKAKGERAAGRREPPARREQGAARASERDAMQAARSSKVAPTLADHIRAGLETEIATGRLAPGARLDEAEIADRFGASRTPVREAFRLLASGGLVELKGRQGVIVRTIGARSLIEMFQVMAELEGLCARLAARRVTTAQLDELDAIHARLGAASAATDPDRFYDINQAFHEAIYDAAANLFLAEQTRALRNQVAAYRRRVTRMPNRIADTLREHDAVIAAIRAHDPERAHQTMRDHVNLLGDDLIDFLAAFS